MTRMSQLTLTVVLLCFCFFAIDVYSNQQALRSLQKTRFKSPFLPLDGTDSISISKDVVCTSDLLKFEDKEYYESSINDWQSTVMVELNDPQFNVTRLSSLSDSKCVMNWNLTFIPESIGVAAFLGKRLPFLSLSTFDILHKERLTSQFSWQALFKFVKTTITTGEVKIPLAVIQGQTTFTFEKEDKTGDTSHDEKEGSKLTLIRQEEKLSLIRSIDNKLLKNRALANHLQEFLYIRRPSSVSMYELDDIIVTRVQFSKSVPGMRQFDIDGISGQEQQDLIKGSNKVLSVGVGTTLLFSLVFFLQVAMNEKLFSNF